MFPPEIIAIFVQELADGGEDLAPLLLVSKSFYQPARRHLFRTIQLFFAPDGDYNDSDPEAQKDVVRHERLLLLIQATPEVLSYVRRLEVYGSTLGSFENSNGAILVGTAQQEAFDKDRSLLKEFEDAPIQELVIDSIAGSIIDSLVPLRSLPTIRSLSILHCGGVPSPLFLGKDNLPGLHNLKIVRSSSYLKRPTLPPATTASPPNDPFLPFSLLTVLITCDPSDLVHMISDPPYSTWRTTPAICLVEFPALKILHLGTPASRPFGVFWQDHYAQMWATFARAPALEEISVDGDLRDYPWNLVFNTDKQVIPYGVNTLRQLKKLTLKHTCRAEGIDSALRRAIIPMLNDFQSFAHSNLASLVLEFSDCHEDSQRQYDVTANGEVPSCWLKLCDTLVQFTALNEVRLMFSARVVERDSEAARKVHEAKPRKLVEELRRRYKRLDSCLSTVVEVNFYPPAE